MKETPIQFTDEMVRLIVDGRKTQTRRPLKPQPVHDETAWATYWEGPNSEGKYGPSVWGFNERPGKDVLLHCPYGFPGDDLLCHPRGLLAGVKAVRIERVQEISLADMVAEGVASLLSNSIVLDVACLDGADSAALKAGWQELWDSLYLARGLGWEVNPWVWVLEFTRCQDRMSTQ